jgi:hypothetical protein
VSASYEVVPYRPELREELLRIQMWSDDRSFADAYFRWKHEENPYQEAPLVWLALSGGKAVGMRSFFTTRWEAGQPPVSFDALYADDFSIVPEHRDRGLVSRIMEAAFRDLTGRCELAVSLSAGGVTHLTSLASGWKSVERMKPLGRRPASAPVVSLARRILRRVPLLRQAPARAVELAAGLREPFRRLDRETPGPSRMTVGREPRSAAMARLERRVRGDGRIRHVRDERFTSWRYRNPMHAYRFLYKEGGDGLDGYLVLQTPLAPRFLRGRVSIVDWEARDEDTRMELLDAALARGFAELVVWSATVPPPVRDALARRGFRPVDASRTSRGYPALLLRPIGTERVLEGWNVGGRALLDPESWDLRMIDSMHG